MQEELQEILGLPRFSIINIFCKGGAIFFGKCFKNQINSNPLIIAKQQGFFSFTNDFSEACEEANFNFHYFCTKRTVQFVEINYYATKNKNSLSPQSLIKQ